MLQEGATTCSPGLSGLVGSKYEKPKGWMQLTDTEKIERLREIIKQQASQLNRIYQMENRIQKLRELITEHSHNGTEVVSKINKYEGSLGNDCAKAECGIGSKQNPEDIYF